MASHSYCLLPLHWSLLLVIYACREHVQCRKQSLLGAGSLIKRLVKEQYSVLRMQGSPVPLLVFSLLVSLVPTECGAEKVQSLLGKIWSKAEGTVKKEVPSSKEVISLLLLSLDSVCSLFCTISVGGTAERVHIMPVSCTHTFITFWN